MIGKKKAEKKQVSTNNFRIGFTVYQKNGNYTHKICTSDEYLNLTLGGCYELLNMNFRNIVIDFDFEHPRFIHFEPIKETKQGKKYYILARRFDDKIDTLQTDIISEVIFYLNQYQPNKQRLYKRFEIVNIR